MDLFKLIRKIQTLLLLSSITLICCQDAEKDGLQLNQGLKMASAESFSSAFEPLLRSKRQAQCQSMQVNRCVPNPRTTGQRVHTVTLFAHDRNSNPNNFLRPSREQSQDIQQIVNSWSGRRIELNDQSRTLLQTRTMRIDLQNSPNSIYLDGRSYANLQIQLNVPRASGRSTTFSQIFVPRGITISVRYFKYMFHESIPRRAAVWLFINGDGRGSPYGRLNKQGPDCVRNQSCP